MKYFVHACYLEIVFDAGVHLVETLNFFVELLFWFQVNVHVVAEHQTRHVRLGHSTAFSRQMLHHVVEIVLEWTKSSGVHYYLYNRNLYTCFN